MTAALAEEKRPSRRRGVGRFLALHEDCGADFDVHRPSGPRRGSLRLVCNGCGARAEYDSTQPDVLTAIDALEHPNERTDRRRSRKERERRLPAPAARPWWGPSASIIVGLAIGLALIAFGVFGPKEEEPAAVRESPPSAAPQVAPSESAVHLAPQNAAEPQRPLEAATDGEAVGP